MRALTVRQPWAWAIVHGGKDVENRTWRTSHRGTLAIHAGEKWDDDGGYDAQIIEAATAASPADGPMVRAHGVDPRFEDYHRSAVIGLVDLVGMHPAWRMSGDACCASAWGQFLWPDDDRTLWHWELGNPRPLPEPVLCRGRQQVWTLGNDVRDLVLEQLVEATA